MELVEPIRNRLSIPPQRHIFGIVNGSIAINFLSLSVTLRVYWLLFQLSFLKRMD
jgi:hypothetical protein